MIPPAIGRSPGGLTASEFTPASDLPSGTQFFWKVRALNALGVAAHSSAFPATRTFKTKAAPALR